MRYVPWVGKVFGAVASANRGSLGGGAALAAIGAVLGFESLTWDDFVQRDGPAGALMTPMDDLDRLGIVDFQNVDYGNAPGRDLLEPGLPGVWPELFEIPASATERTFLARLLCASAVEGDGRPDPDCEDRAAGRPPGPRASPQWAAIAALANQARAGAGLGPLGFLNPRLYALAESGAYATDFHDITIGNNQLSGTPVGFGAGTGYDAASGWGTPDVAKLVSDLAKP